MNDNLELVGNMIGNDGARILFDAFVSRDDFDEAFYDFCGFHYDFLVGNDPYERFVYRLLKNHYRNDYFIRHTFFDKVLSKKKAVSFFEMPISSSRVDMASINGISVGYEIKTEYDNLHRLSKQIADYSRTLEYIYVVCPHSMVPQVEKTIPDHCGIYSYDEKRSNSSFKLILEARRSPALDASAMLQCMLKEELKGSFKKTSIEAIAEEFSLDEIDKALKESLKKRYAPRMAEIENRVGLMVG